MRPTASVTGEMEAEPDLDCMSSINVVSVPCGHKVGKGHGLNRTDTTVLRMLIYPACSINLLIRKIWVQGNRFATVKIEKFMWIVMLLIRSSQMQRLFMPWLHPLDCLLSSLFPTETLSSLYLDSAVFRPGSHCNDLFPPASTEESLPIFHSRWKLISSSHPLRLPFLPLISWSYFLTHNSN